MSYRICISRCKFEILLTVKLDYCKNEQSEIMDISKIRLVPGLVGLFKNVSVNMKSNETN